MPRRHVSRSSSEVSAEERILTAASAEFASTGFYGARTQAIADAAGVNKAMLHYYFRSKENLYSHVIRDAFRKVLTRAAQSWSGPEPLLTRIERLVDSFMDNYEQNPGLLKIVLREVVEGGGRLKEAITEMKKAEFPLTGYTPGRMVREAAGELGLSTGETIHFLVNLIGMCVVSFTSPLLLENILDVDVSNMKAFLRDRRKAIKSMVLASAETLMHKPARRRKP